MVDGLRARELQKLIDDYRGTFRVVIILWNIWYLNFEDNFWIQSNHWIILNIFFSKRLGSVFLSAPYWLRERNYEGAKDAERNRFVTLILFQLLLHPLLINCRWSTTDQLLLLLLLLSHWTQVYRLGSQCNRSIRGREIQLKANIYQIIVHGSNHLVLMMIGRQPETALNQRLSSAGQVSVCYCECQTV